MRLSPLCICHRHSPWGSSCACPPRPPTTLGTEGPGPPVDQIVSHSIMWQPTRHCPKSLLFPLHSRKARPHDMRQVHGVDIHKNGGLLWLLQEVGFLLLKQLVREFRLTNVPVIISGSTGESKSNHSSRFLEPPHPQSHFPHCCEDSPSWLHSQAR